LNSQAEAAENEFTSAFSASSAFNGVAMVWLRLRRAVFSAIFALKED
jgi:hypothetical protein